MLSPVGPVGAHTDLSAATPGKSAKTILHNRQGSTGKVRSGERTVTVGGNSGGPLNLAPIWSYVEAPEEGCLKLRARIEMYQWIKKEKKDKTVYKKEWRSELAVCRLTVARGSGRAPMWLATAPLFVIRRGLPLLYSPCCANHVCSSHTPKPEPTLQILGAGLRGGGHL